MMFPVALRMPEPGSLTHRPQDCGQPHYRQDVTSAIYVQGADIHKDTIAHKRLAAKRPCVDEFVCSQGSSLPVLMVDGKVRQATADGGYSEPIELRKQVGQTVEQGRNGDLYFLQEAKDHRTQVAVRHADDGKVHQLYLPEQGGVSDLRLDETGQNLLIGVHQVGLWATTELLKYDLQTGQTQKLVSDPEVPMSDFQLSHDGQLLAYTDAAEGRVYIKDLKAETSVSISASEKLLPEPDGMFEDILRGQLQFSPDDSRLFYSRQMSIGGSAEVHERRGELLVAPVEGGDIERLMGSLNRCMPFAYEMQALSQPLQALK